MLRYQALRDFAEETAEVVFTADGELFCLALLIACYAVLKQTACVRRSLVS